MCSALFSWESPLGAVDPWAKVWRWEQQNHEAETAAVPTARPPRSAGRTRHRAGPGHPAAAVSFALSRNLDPAECSCWGTLIAAAGNSGFPLLGVNAQPSDSEWDGQIPFFSKLDTLLLSTPAGPTQATPVTSAAGHEVRPLALWGRPALCCAHVLPHEVHGVEDNAPC